MKNYPENIKELITENKVLIIICIWTLSIIGYMYLWWNVLPFTMRTGVIVLALIFFAPLIFVGVICKFKFDAWKGYTVLCLVIMLALIAFTNRQTPLPDISSMNFGNTVVAHVRSLDFNVDKLSEHIGDRTFHANYDDRWWGYHFKGAFIIRTNPNFRFTNQQLEELADVAARNENLHVGVGGRGLDVWITYTHYDDLLRTYNENISPFTVVRRGVLSTVYGVEENIAVIEIGFYMSNWYSYILRLPLVDKYGELQMDNFEWALQLHQIILGEIAEGTGVGEQESRPFERAREVLAELREAT